MIVFEGTETEIFLYGPLPNQKTNQQLCLTTL